MTIEKKNLIPVPIPSCADVLLSQVTRGSKDDITKYFEEYFAFEKYTIIEYPYSVNWNKIPGDDEKILNDFLIKRYGFDWIENTSPKKRFDEDNIIEISWHGKTLTLKLDKKKKIVSLEIKEVKDGKEEKEIRDEFNVKEVNDEPIIYLEKYDVDLIEALQELPELPEDCSKFPSKHCLPTPCVTLKGIRRLTDDVINKGGTIRRLFIGDMVWLFYFERMGIFKILGVILDDFATKGKIPLPNDEALAIVLETMVRNTKMGLSSTVRDRNSSYRRCLGWTTDAGRNLQMDTMVNSGFTNLFHKMIQNSLEYYKYKRLADVLEKGTPPSVATLTTISDTIEVLKKSFKPFDYGRNHFNTLNGIVWVIAAMDMIKRSRENLGIPKELDAAHEYIPAAYDILVMGRPITPSETNRYIIHKECAEYARAVILDLEFLDHTKTGKGEELEKWLDSVEDEIEGYRTAYRTLTGIDVGIPPTSVVSGIPKIEQQV